MLTWHTMLKKFSKSMVSNSCLLRRLNKPSVYVAARAHQRKVENLLPSMHCSRKMQTATCEPLTLFSFQWFYCLFSRSDLLLLLPGSSALSEEHRQQWHHHPAPAERNCICPASAPPPSTNLPPPSLHPQKEKSDCAVLLMDYSYCPQKHTNVRYIHTHTHTPMCCILTSKLHFRR